MKHNNNNNNKRSVDFHALTRTSTLCTGCYF